ncbi:hypothetical protein EJD97_023912, partial [Solanum chilense]
SPGTCEEYSDDGDINLDYDSDSSQLDHSKEALFDVIQHIKDNQARNHFLLELKNILLDTDTPKPHPNIDPFSMKQIISRSESNSVPTISDLCHEVSTLKDEIRNIKPRLSILETDIPIYQDYKKPAKHDFESKHSSSGKNSDDDDIDINPSKINNDHLVEDFAILPVMTPLLLQHQV